MAIAILQRLGTCSASAPPPYIGSCVGGTERVSVLAMRLGSILCGDRLSSKCVCLLRDDAEMRDVYAQRRTAEMVNHQSIGDRPVRQFPRYAVRRTRSSVQMETAVAVTGPRTDPLDASIRQGVAVEGETFRNGDLWRECPTTPCSEIVLRTKSARGVRALATVDGASTLRMHRESDPFGAMRAEADTSRPHYFTKLEVPPGGA